MIIKKIEDGVCIFDKSKSMYLAADWSKTPVVAAAERWHLLAVASHTQLSPDTPSLKVKH